MKKAVAAWLLSVSLLTTALSPATAIRAESGEPTGNSSYLLPVHTDSKTAQEARPSLAWGMTRKALGNPAFFLYVRDGAEFVSVREALDAAKQNLNGDTVDGTKGGFSYRFLGQSCLLLRMTDSDGAKISDFEIGVTPEEEIVSGSAGQYAPEEGFELENAPTQNFFAPVKTAPTLIGTAPAPIPVPVETASAPTPKPVETAPAPTPVPVETAPAPIPVPAETAPAPAPVPVETAPAPIPAPAETAPAPTPAPVETAPAGTVPEATPSAPLPEESAPVTPQIKYAALSLAVPVYRQYDTRWDRITLGGSGETIRAVGCTVTSLAMSEAYLHDASVTPATVADTCDFDENGCVCWPAGYRRIWGGDCLALIYERLQQGIPTIVHATKNNGVSHWVIVTGFAGGDALTAGAFTINDPATVYRTTLSDFFAVYPNYVKIAWYAG